MASALLRRAAAAPRHLRPARRPLSSAADAVGRVGIVGAGQMGLGIAIVSAQTAAKDVTLYDISAEQLDAGLGFAAKLLQKSVDKGKLEPAARDEALGRITTTTQLADMSSADFVIEAATENVELKLELFAQLDAIAPPGVRPDPHPPAPEAPAPIPPLPERERVVCVLARRRSLRRTRRRSRSRRLRARLRGRRMSSACTS